MAISPIASYPTKVAAATPSYPYGEAQNVTAPGDGTGTPWEQAIVNDMFGIFQKLLSEAGIVPSGNADTVLVSDYFDSLEKLFSRVTTYADTGTANAKVLNTISGANPAAYFDGQRAGFFVNTTNTGPVTIGVGLLPVRQVRFGGVGLTGQEMKAGTYAEVVFDFAGNFWALAQAAPASGSVVKVGNFQTGAVNTGVTPMTGDDTIPTNVEGDQYMALAFTPTKATNYLKIEVLANLAHTSLTPGLQMALFKDAVVNALAGGIATHSNVANASGQVALTHYMVAGSVAAITFKVRAGSGAGATTTFNGAAGVRIYGGVMASSITITEIEA